MIDAFLDDAGSVSRAFAVGPVAPQRLRADVEWLTAGHPLPDARSVTAARRVLDIAADRGAEDSLVVLLSGGASALLALPPAPISLAEKAGTVRLLLERGADIGALNTVRKHLSGIKGGRLACATRAHVLTLAISDVVGDDLSMIASGPTVGDPTTFAMALEVLDRHGGRERFARPVVEWLEGGDAGLHPDSPKPDDPRLSRSAAHVIGNRLSAVEGARGRAEGLGYAVRVLSEPVTGPARDAAQAFVAEARQVSSRRDRPICVLAAGETTVRVVGRGRGGRNQELALAMADPLATVGARVAAASIGTDGVDGPTDAAGAVVDSTTVARALEARLSVPAHLADNDSYTFFDRLGDLIRVGPTGTNVGDLQIMLVA
jgi:hydroxypyruvate reductase